MKSFIKKNPLLILIVIIGLYLRINNYEALYYHAHDQDLSAWIVKDILQGHIRLIGQQTSQLGVFIGPAFYYALIPFYLLANMEPVGGIFLVTIISLLTLLSYYYVLSKIFGKTAGLVAAFLYAINFSIILTDREVVPTSPVILWSVWFLYDLWLIYNAKFKRGFLFLGILIGFIWHINLALVL